MATDHHREGPADLAETPEVEDISMGVSDADEEGEYEVGDDGEIFDSIAAAIAAGLSDD